jgi:pimeloyl-ACP methyl ester carboxylesterase
MTMNYVRRGTGKPLLLIHGIGSSHHSWDLIIDGLTAERDVIAVDLPGFGDTPPLAGETSIRTLADAVTDFLAENNLTGIDAVGSSMGARLVLELARRSRVARSGWLLAGLGDSVLLPIRSAVSSACQQPATCSARADEQSH